MTQFICGVFEQFGRHGLFHRPLHHLGTKPILVVREPLVGKRTVEQINQFITFIPTISRPLVPMGTSFVSNERFQGLSSRASFRAEAFSVLLQTSPPTACASR